MSLECPFLNKLITVQVAVSPWKFRLQYYNSLSINTGETSVGLWVLSCPKKSHVFPHRHLRKQSKEGWHPDYWSTLNMHSHNQLPSCVFNRAFQSPVYKGGKASIWMSLNLNEVSGIKRTPAVRSELKRSSTDRVVRLQTFLTGIFRCTFLKCAWSHSTTMCPVHPLCQCAI